MVKLEGQRIIVTFLMHLGDLTLTTPFLHVLRQAAPRAHITYLVDEKLQEVVAHNPNIDAVMTIDKKGKDNSIRALLAKARQISEGHYDVLINLHPNERCSFIGAMAQVPVKVGASHFLFRHCFHPCVKLNRRLHAADMYLDVLRRLGVTNLSNKGLEIVPGAAAEAAAASYWRQEGLAEQDKLIGFNIGSAVAAKRWPPERFAQVADTLAGEGYRTVFFGGTMDEQRVREATALMQSRPIIATGAFSLGALAAAMHRCSLIITNDSGPMHVAISQKVPIVAMYGPSHPALYGPYTDKAVIVQGKLNGQVFQGRMKDNTAGTKWMEAITVAEVLTACTAALKLV